MKKSFSFKSLILPCLMLVSCFVANLPTTNNVLALTTPVITPQQSVEKSNCNTTY